MHIKYINYQIQLNKFLFISLFVLLMSGCEQSDQSGPGTKESETIHPVRLGITQSPPSWLTHIAEHNGYFKKQGLNVITTSFKSGKRALNGMFKNKVDIAATAEGPVVFNSLTRHDFSIISTIGVSSNDNMIVARKDRGIQSAKDLRGKIIATQSASAAHFYLHLFLTKNKLTGKDISQSFMKVEKLPEAIISGKVDAISTREPFYSEAMTTLGANAIAFKTPGLYLKSFQLVAFNAYIKENPEILYKILNGLVLAEHFVKAHSDQTIEILTSKFGLTKDRITATLRYLDLSVTLDQSLILQLEDEARWVIQQKLVNTEKIPNYLHFIHANAFTRARPDVMTIIGIK